MDVVLDKPRLRRLLDHFAEVADPREPWRVAHPLPEVLLLVVCGSIASCDDFDDIAAWGRAHLDFLRRFLPFDHGVPGERWLNILMNRIDPELFAACFMSWARELRPDAPELLALDGKTSRRTHDRAAGLAPLHLVSAFATRERLVLGQEAVRAKSNEIEAIPALLGKLAEAGSLKGALVSIDAIACNPKIAAAITGHGADYLLAVKANQSHLQGEIERFFQDAPPESLEVFVDVDKGHGRIEDRRVFVSKDVEWLVGDRRFPGEHRFPAIAAVAKVETRTELADRCRRETRLFITSRPLSAQDLAAAVRSHWRIENALHWVLDVTFNEDQSRLRKGHGAKNMAIVRHFALNLVRTANDRHSLKTRRKLAGWDQNYLASLIGASGR
ncbi:MAG TPA: ISAs1 family transposase [Methylomirabilota bacterium]|uniref:ISAs1 family transposase n=1 Tax=Phenylobacterium sp. TaxID=1871053 RepID=UPI002B47B7AD|nr:ISAs1 family transposase [Phenylobacterium sp.]HJR01643.1 ISAs1 family transposase [Methylomirabilota bacterium]HKR88048.1 ISAs1 family transposase [Phenylobacterium sp.]